MRGIQCATAYPRHCERQRSNPHFGSGTDGLLRSARNDGGYNFAFSRRDAPEVFQNLLSQKREQGMPGARCTRGLVCKQCAKKRTRAYRYSRNTPAFPAQWLYGLWRALPGDEFVLPPSLANWRLIKPGRVDFASAQLGTSNGCRDHTVLPYASAPFILRAVVHSRRDAALRTRFAPDAAASTASHPASVTIAKRPSLGWDGPMIAMICPTGRVEYFLQQNWTTQISLKCLRNLASARMIGKLQRSYPATACMT